MSTKGKIYLGDILVSNPPEGSIEITENGTIDVTDYETANVNVAGSGGSKILNKLNGRIILATDFTGYDTPHGTFNYIYEFSEQPTMGTIIMDSHSTQTNDIIPDVTAATNYYNYFRYGGASASFGTSTVTESFSPVPATQRDYVITSYYHAPGHTLSLNGTNLTITIGSASETNKIYWENHTHVVVLGWKFQDESYDFDVFLVQYGWVPCFVKGTQITLADGIKKNIEDITYDDDIIVWDFDNGRSTTAKAIWITRSGLKADSYTKVTLSDGTIMKLCGPKSHRLLCLEDNAFTYAVNMVGKRTFKQNGKVVEVVSAETVNEEVEYYNIITDYHMNLYANGVLTSCRYSNLYPIEDVRASRAMKYIKEDRPIVPFEAYEGKIGRKWYDSLRLGEQTIPVEETIKYIERLEALKK